MRRFVRENTEITNQPSFYTHFYLLTVHMANEKSGQCNVYPLSYVLDQ